MHVWASQSVSKNAISIQIIAAITFTSHDFDDFSERSNGVMWCAVSVEARLSVNVALNRPSYQSSTYSDSRATLHADYANDGNHGTHVYNAPCAHTSRQTNPFWTVDLGVPLYVHGVNFTNTDATRMYNTMP